MNQIIYNLDNESDIENNFKSPKKKNYLKIQLYILIIITISILIYYGCFRYDLYTKEKISKSLMESFSITKIYESSSEYNTALLNQEIFFYENSSFSVIGIIEIKKIDISYPILSNINKDLLKVSPCRFYGPMPNTYR